MPWEKTAFPDITDPREQVLQDLDWWIFWYEGHMKYTFLVDQVKTILDHSGNYSLDQLQDQFNALKLLEDL